VTVTIEPRSRIADRFLSGITRRLGRGPTRRSFLVNTAVVGSALVVSPLKFLLRPGTAYAALCGPDAGCDSGWTAMCCSIDGGVNSCPPGTVPAGWWKADNSGFCNGAARYYIDCNATCGPCGCGPNGLCASSCVACTCHCASGTCDTRHVCCTQFRYGQCNQDIACLGPIVCRVVTCVPPWQFDSKCTTTSATSNATALHDAPCLHYDHTSVFGFGDAPGLGAPAGALRSPIVGMDSTPSGDGYWLVAADGGVFSFGDAKFHGSTGGIHLNRPIVGIAATRTGQGYWLVASDGGIFSFGDARFHGSTGRMKLNRPIVGIAATQEGEGYWLVASDGGIFSFGDARFHGSTGAMKLNQPIVGMAATRSARGYWLVASDGGIFSFGNARFQGSTGNIELNQPIVDMAPSRSSKGYWLVAADGGVFCFGDAGFFGSLHDVHAPAGHTIGMATQPTGDGYWITSAS
jgi:hypothetical protein